MWKRESVDYCGCALLFHHIPHSRVDTLLTFWNVPSLSGVISALDACVSLDPSRLTFLVSHTFRNRASFKRFFSNSLSWHSFDVYHSSLQVMAVRAFLIDAWLPGISSSFLLFFCVIPAPKSRHFMLWVRVSDCPNPSSTWTFSSLILIVTSEL